MRTDLRQPMDVGRIVDWAIRIYRLQFPAFFLIALVTVPLNLLGGVLPVELDLSNGSDALRALRVLGPVLLAGAFVNILASAAMSLSVQDIDENRPVDFGRAYDVVFSRLGDLVVALLRVWVPVLLLAATVIGLPVAVWLGVRWSFFGQAVMIDRAPGAGAPGRSAQLVAGGWWRVFGILLLVALISVPPQLVVAEITSLGPQFVAALINAVVAALILPFVVIADTLLYFDLSARREGHVTAAPDNAA